MESLCGSLNFFAAGLLTVGLKTQLMLLVNITTLFKVTEAVREDARIWLTFLHQYNGRSIFPELSWSKIDTLNLFINSCGS